MTLRKILICGLSGAGKSTLAKALARKIGAVHFDADAIRAMCGDTDFSPQGRMMQAIRMRNLCEAVTVAGHPAIADFICPTRATRAAFEDGESTFTVWVDTIQSSNYPDTDAMFEPPQVADVIVKSKDAGYWAHIIAEKLNSGFDPKEPTATFVGRYQKFHGGHRALIDAGMERTGAAQAFIAVRDTFGTSPRDPYSFAEVEESIHAGMGGFKFPYRVQLVPNISAICYGRDVGYSIERIELEPEIEAISATKLRMVEHGR